MSEPDLERRRLLFLLGLAGAAAGLSGHRLLTSSVVPAAQAAVLPPSPTLSTTTRVRPIRKVPTTTTPPTTAPPLEQRRIPLICRDAWEARPPLESLVAHTIDRITVHHTAVPLWDNTVAPSRLRAHQAYHLGLGWPDLAYHYMVDARGNVYEGRPTSARGDTATDYDPTGHLLVCLEGHFDQQPLPEAQREAAVDLLAWGCSHFGIAPEAIRGHRDHATTTCPGASVSAAIQDGSLQASVRDRLNRAEWSLQPVCGPEGAALVDQIERGEA